MFIAPGHVPRKPTHPHRQQPVLCAGWRQQELSARHSAAVQAGVMSDFSLAAFQMLCMHIKLGPAQASAEVDEGATPHSRFPAPGVLCVS